MILFPVPKSLTLTEGTCPAAAPVNVVTDAALGNEEYKIDITAAGVTLTTSCDEGTFRAKTTLKQITAQNPDALPCLSIHDWPDFPNRGLWYQCAGRVPTVETMKKHIDFLADMKVNNLHLGVSDHPSMKAQPETPVKLTQAEMMELTAYASERYMHLVPNVQTFGHIEPWLALPEYADLAECPDGYDMWGTHRRPSTLNPLDPRSQEVVKELLKDVIPICDGEGMINIGCDETWELGQGKSKEECERLGKTRVFLNFVTDTINYLLENNIKPMFWADIILQGSQEVLNDIPKESIALNWGYERWEVTEDSCIRMEKTGVPYWNCPGTSNWNSMLAQSYKAMQNIARCAVLGKRHGASGLLNTDWPDRCLHHFSPSYVGLAYGAAMGWTVAESDWVPIEPYECKDDLHAIVEPNAAQIVKVSPTMASCFDYLNKFVYQDKKNNMAQIAYDAGLYGHISTHASIHNTTTLRRILDQDHAKKDVYGYDAKDFYDTRDYLEVINYRLAHHQAMACEDAQDIIDEYHDAINMLQYAVDLALSYVGDLQGYSEEAFAEMMRTQGEDVIREHERVWMLRNKGTMPETRRHFQHFAE